MTTIFLTPGAGSSADHPSLRAVEALFDGPVVRHDFPYRREGRKAPDRAPTAIADLVEATAGLERPLVLGGRSFGGRMCSMAVADGLVDGVIGLVLVCYPLHPPGKPENLRTEHLPRVEVPCLFVSGTKDAFGTPAELEAATAAIPGPVTHRWIDGGRHDLRGADGEVAACVAGWIATL